MPWGENKITLISVYAPNQINVEDLCSLKISMIIILLWEVISIAILIKQPFITEVKSTLLISWKDMVWKMFGEQSINQVLPLNYLILLNKSAPIRLGFQTMK